MIICITAKTNVTNVYLDTFEMIMDGGISTTIDSDETIYQRNKEKMSLEIILKGAYCLKEDDEVYLNGYGEEISRSTVKCCLLYTEDDLPGNPYFQIETITIGDNNQSYEMLQEFFNNVIIEDQNGTKIDNINNKIGLTWKPTQKEEGICMFKLPDDSPLRPHLIGVVRGDFGSNGDGFYHTWMGHKEEHNDANFKNALEEVINHFRFKDKSDFLRDFSSMEKYCKSAQPNISFRDHLDNRGVRVDKDGYTFIIRLIPEHNNYNFYCWCYYDYLSDRYSLSIRLQSYIDEREWSTTVSGFSSAMKAKNELLTYTRHLIAKNEIKEKFIKIQVSYTRYNLLTNTEEYLDSDEGDIFCYKNSLTFYDSTLEYPHTFGVDLDESICGRKSAVIIIRSQDDMDDLVKEFDGVLPAVREFDTVDGDSIDSSWIIRSEQSA